jgi:hypothetical protein
LVSLGSTNSFINVNDCEGFFSVAMLDFIQK